MKTVVYDHQIFALQQYGGISRYFCELATRIHRDGRYSVKVVAPLHYNDYLAQCAVPVIGRHVPMRVRRTGRLYRAASGLLSLLPALGPRPAIVHRTYYGHTFAPPGVRTVVTVYDMIHELFPQSFPPSDRTSQQKRKAVLDADLVICISSSTAEDLTRLFGVSADKIRVTHLGFSDTFSQQVVAPRSAVGRPYLLYVGHRPGYKNFDGLLRAYATSRLLREDVDILAFGGSTLSAGERDLIRQLDLREDSVRRVAGTDQELAAAYVGALAFVYPSKYEGFGIPPLEAMAMQCPVACSNSSSIPEVVGEAAELFDPNDSEDIARAIELVCFDDDKRQELVVAGRNRLRLFSWDRCADQTARIYTELTG